MSDSGIRIEGQDFEYDVDGNYKEDSNVFADNVSILKYLKQNKKNIKHILTHSQKTALVLMIDDVIANTSRFVRICSAGTEHVSDYYIEDKHLIKAFLQKHNFIGKVKYGPHILINKHMHIKTGGKTQIIEVKPVVEAPKNEKYFSNLHVDNADDVCPECNTKRAPNGACSCI